MSADLAPSSKTPFLDGAISAWTWIESKASHNEGGVSWPAAEGSSQVSDTLYHGMPGGVLLGSALANAAGSANLRDRALAVSGGYESRLRSALAPSASHAPDVPAMGLYTGRGGIAAVSAALGRLVPGKPSSALSELAYPGFLDSIEANAARSEWGDSTDVVSGAAGVGFTLLDLQRRKIENVRSLRLARACADWLIGQGEPAGEGALKWRIGKQTKLVYPNFSHGTSGVATFLAELYRDTRDARYLEAARQGAKYMESIAKVDAGGVCWVHHEGEDLTYAGWCHGPAGTIRMYYSLWRATGEKRWIERAGQCAEWLLRNARAEDLKQGSGLWNVSMCCGVAGIGDALCDWYHVSKDARCLRAAKACGDYLLQAGVREADGMKWPQAEHRVRPELVQAQTGYSQGAAGIGLFLLKLHLVSSGKKALPWRLPDNPFGAP